MIEDILRIDFLQLETKQAIQTGNQETGWIGNRSLAQERTRTTKELSGSSSQRREKLVLPTNHHTTN
jgi:hypothetical protein